MFHMFPLKKESFTCVNFEGSCIHVFSLGLGTPLGSHLQVALFNKNPLVEESPLQLKDNSDT
jgi:hypothetical protein